MDKDISIDSTPRCKLEFCFEEVDSEKELDNSRGKKLVIEQQASNLDEIIPKIGMEFDSEEATYKFYNEYAKLAGFGIRKHTIHKDIKGRIIDRTFCYACQGYRIKDKRDVSVKSHRPKIRKGCRAMMRIDARHTGKFKVVNFIADHNGHDLVSPAKTRFLRSHRSIIAVQASLADDIDYS